MRVLIEPGRHPAGTGPGCWYRGPSFLVGAPAECDRSLLGVVRLHAFALEHPFQVEDMNIRGLEGNRTTVCVELELQLVPCLQFQEFTNFARNRRLPLTRQSSCRHVLLLSRYLV